MANKSIKILAIDDNPDNLNVLEALIMNAFHEVVFLSADSGRAGLDLCQTEKPDVILLDIVMPGMDGYETCTRIKSDVRLKNIPVLMVISNRTDKASRVKALDAGADAFLPRPVDESELKAQLRAMLRIKEAEDLKNEEKQRLEDVVLDRTEALENELADRIKAEDKLIKSLDKINRNRQAIMNLMEDLKSEMNERIQIEANLQLERNMLRTLIDNIPFPIYVLDKEGRKVIANKADVENICFNSETEVLGKTDLELFLGEIGIRGHANNMDVIRSGKPNIDIEENFININGQERWLLSSQYPLFETSGEIKGLVGIGFDITERRKLEKKIIESEAYYRTLLDLSPDGILIVDMEGTLVYTSEKSREIFKVPPETDVTGTSILSWVNDDYHVTVMERFSDILNGKIVPETREYKLSKFDKTPFWAELSSSLIVGSNESQNMLMIVFRDISQRKNAENELIRSKEKAEESDILKTAFIHNISHEIRTPMNAIIGFSSLLSEPGLDEESQKSFVDVITQSSNHLLEIVSDIIEISNIEAGLIKISICEVKVNEMLNQLLEQYKFIASEKGIRFTLKKKNGNSELRIDSDKTKLFQILSNLLSNSFKFTSKGEVQFGYEIKNNYIEFFVSDTGIGIPKTQHMRIFERFYQVENSLERQYEGTGLGLSISKAYVELLGGEIWMSSVHGKGSVFYFTIPSI